ncbi:MAG TPA: hypothetical protein VF553_00245 [Pyrinomonadaceae bacterium]|jgi:hypothetical protein
MADGKLKIGLIAFLLLTPSLAFAQSSRAQRTAATQKPQGETVVVARAGEQETLRSDHAALVKATETYKSSLRDLMALRENRVAQATEELARVKELYRDGLISRVEFEKSEAALVELKGQVEEVRQKLKAADQMLAEALVETEAVAASSSVVAATIRSSSVKRVAYIRYVGSGNWDISEAAKIESFFVGRFGRALPVSAYGQSELHNRWGYDHRNAIDVALHPDSPEGKSLISYLSSQRIPFIAFREAVPGSATGPHIHIGRPSSKTSTQ